MKSPFLIATLLSSAVTSVTAAGPFLFFHNKFSPKSIEKWAKYIHNHPDLDKQYRLEHGYEGVNTPLNTLCPPHLKDTEIFLLSATGRNWDNKIYYMTGVDQINEVDMGFYLRGLEGHHCGIVGVKTERPPTERLESPKWGNPFFLPYNQENLSKYENALPTRMDKLKIDAGDALSNAAKRVPQLKNGFKEVVLTSAWANSDPFVQPMYHFRGLKQERALAVQASSEGNQVTGYYFIWVNPDGPERARFETNSEASTEDFSMH